MKILLYTHSDVDWVWPSWHQQTDLYLQEYKKICLVNDKETFKRDDYTVIQYDDNLIYRNRISSCLEHVDPNDVVMFHHEDMFLYDTPKYSIIKELCDLVTKDKVHAIKMCRVGEDLEQYDNYPLLYKNPSEYPFTIQPTIIKAGVLKKIFEKISGNTIWEFESNCSKIKDLKSYCCYSPEDKKRGIHHYNSIVYPYIATAVVKGNWNFSEYQQELNKILNL